MKTFLGLVFTVTLTLCAHATKLGDNIMSEAIIVTKAELRRHMAAAEDDIWRPATYAELEASRGKHQPDYLILRFRMPVPGHYSGEAEAKVDGAKHGIKVNVLLHMNKGWVEYFIPLDGLIYRAREDGAPSVAVSWSDLKTK